MYLIMQCSARLHTIGVRYRDHVSLRHVLGENVVFFAKTKIPPKYGIYGLGPTADHNPRPKSALTPQVQPSLPLKAVFSIPKLKDSGYRSL
jgi:hypothetical protein